MKLRKINGPRAVRLSDGRILSRADLPSIDTTRWVPSRKATLVHAVSSGLISRKEILARYSISNEEFQSWIDMVSSYGERALKVTSLQAYRGNP